MIEQAKIREAKLHQTKDPQNGANKEKERETTVSKPENPIMIKLRQAMERAGTKATEARVKEAESVEAVRETANNEEMVRSFLAMIQQVQELATLKLISAGKTERSARSQVDQLNAPDQVKLLGNYASNDTDVQDILTSLEIINNEPRIRDTLYGAIDWWYKPLSTIGTMEALDEFLTDCLKAGMVSLKYGKKPSDQAVTIKVFGQNDKHYAPKPEKAEAVAGWTFCKEAEGWAIKNWDAMIGLRQKATLGLTPYLISNKGREGNLFVQLSYHEAVLLEVRVQGSLTTVRCSASVGLEGDNVPDDKEYQWDNHRKTVGNPKSDAWIWIADVISQMAHDQYMASRQRLDAKGERVKPLLQGTTVSSHFKDQGLTRVLQGNESVVVAVWWEKFDWNKKEGFLGCRVSWQNGILVEEVVCDHFFPKLLVGTVMPATINAMLRLELDSLPRNNEKQRAEHTAWKMLEVFLNGRLTQEDRAQSRDTAQADQPASTL